MLLDAMLMMVFGMKTCNGKRRESAVLVALGSYASLCRIQSRRQPLPRDKRSLPSTEKGSGKSIKTAMC